MVAFDLATSGNFCDICFGAVMYRDGGIKNYVSQDTNKKVQSKLHPVTLAQLLIDLDTITSHDLLYGWGSLGYDCKLLAKEAGDVGLSVGVAHNHIDMMWLLMVHTGLYISLAEVAAYHKITLDSRMGAQTPVLWAGTIEDQRKVVKHQHNAVKAIMAAAKHLDKTGMIAWVDKKTGRDCSEPIRTTQNREILKQVLDLPSPSLSKSMQDTTGWLREAVAHATPSHV